MSELTPCNHCTLRRMKARSPEKDFRLQRDDHGWLQVQSRPKGAPEVEGWTPTGSSFMEITDHCVC